MAQKYRSGQKIKILEVKNEYGNLKYPEIQEHINETGTILDCSPMTGVKGTRAEGFEQYLYYIRLDKDDIILEVITEDALAALDE